MVTVRCLKIPTTDSPRSVTPMGKVTTERRQSSCSYRFTCCSLRVTFMAERFF